jgi:hypothetical protein
MSTLPTNIATLAEHAEAIRVLGKRVVGDVIEIGRRLTVCHGMICGPSGRHTEQSWPVWLKSEFGWSEDTGSRYMQLAGLASSRNLRDLNIPVSGLYLLARPSTPADTRDAIIEMAETGEKLSHAKIKEMIDAAVADAREVEREDAAQRQEQALASIRDAMSKLQLEVASKEQAVRAEYDNKFVLTADELDRKVEDLLKPLREQITEYEMRISAQSKSKPAPRLDAKASLAATAVTSAVNDLSKKIGKFSAAELLTYERQLADVTGQDVADVIEPIIRECKKVHKWLEALMAQEIAKQEEQETADVEPVPIVPEPVDGAEIAPPDVLEDNILYTIGRINENARLFNKLLKASALDREAAARINTEIDRMMGKWRSIQSTLAAKAKATTAPEMPVERDNAVDLRELRAEAAKVGYRIHKDRDGYKVVGQDGDSGFGASDLATIGEYIRGEPIPVYTPCGSPLFTINAPPVPETNSGEMPDIPPFLDQRETA